MEESKPEEYTFSEPKVVSYSRALIEIIEWLPDSQRVLITRSIPDTSNENIELFNPQTGEIHIYALRAGNILFRPAWMEKMKSIIYSDWFLTSSPTYDNGMAVPSSIVGRQQLRITNGNPANAQIIEDVQYSRAHVPHEWVTSSIAVKPDGSQIVYLKSTGDLPWRLYSRMISQDGLKSEQQSAIQGNYGGEGVWLEESNKMSWRAGTSQIFFYSYASATNQTFLLDIDSAQVCTLNFGGWVYMARWSPSGRYLAVIKADGPRHPISSRDLVVLDTATGILYPIDSTKVDPPEMKDCCMHFIKDITWAPDNRHLAIIGDADFSGTGNHIYHDTLYLVDFLSGQVDNLFPSYLMIANHSGASLAWSPDGTKLLATCPIETEGRLCLISVQRTPPP